MIRIVIHPTWEPLIDQILKRPIGTITDQGFVPFTGPRAINGVPIDFNPAVPKYKTEWQFPDERFWEYEESDKAWCIPLGIGQWVETNLMAVFTVDIPTPEEMTERLFRPGTWTESEFNDAQQRYDSSYAMQRHRERRMAMQLQMGHS